MPCKISLITAVAVAVVAVAAPAAFGEGRLAGSQEPNGAITSAMAEDGFDRAVAAKLALQPTVSTYRTFGRAEPPVGSAAVPTISSGRGLEWPQIGIGFGVGILLALGLVLALRHTRVRPLAH